jgi:hypothetical protein
MQKFQYPSFAKFIYRYANIPASLLMGLHLVSSFIGLFSDWIIIFPFLINVIVLYLLNRFFFKSYKTFPFLIFADNEKMICTDYFFSKKKIEIKYFDISEIRGGMFSGNTSRPLYIKDGITNETIGLHTHVKDYNKLVTIILSNIKQELYNELLEKAKDQRLDKRISKNKKGKKSPAKPDF